MRPFRRRPSEESVTAAVTAATGTAPGQVAYNHLQYSSGALSGTVDVADAREYAEVLRAAHAALVDVLGGDADRVVVYLTGRSPAGPVGPPDVGLPDRPTGRDLSRLSTP
ncbi:hypothetical protein [Nocardioides aquiterrae]|uniref:hypothetical protein n=1 Tax=Nocardioides aquiterrae TaxID=203799 RepID=UPI0031E44E04